MHHYRLLLCILQKQCSIVFELFHNVLSDVWQFIVHHKRRGRHTCFLCVNRARRLLGRRWFVWSEAKSRQLGYFYYICMLPAVCFSCCLCVRPPWPADLRAECFPAALSSQGPCSPPSGSSCWCGRGEAGRPFDLNLPFLYICGMLCLLLICRLAKQLTRDEQLVELEAATVSWTGSESCVNKSEILLPPHHQCSMLNNKSSFRSFYPSVRCSQHVKQLFMCWAVLFLADYNCDFLSVWPIDRIFTDVDWFWDN